MLAACRAFIPWISGGDWPGSLNACRSGRTRAQLSENQAQDSDDNGDRSNKELRDTHHGLMARSPLSEPLVSTGGRRGRITRSQTDPDGHHERRENQSNSCDQQ
jgi:hypothetical protein